MRFSTILIIILRNFELAIRDLFRLQYRPYKVLFELTDHCNSKCKTCDIWKSDGEKKNEIKVKELEPILEEYGANLLWVALGGGEVTLYKDFDRLIDLLAARCPNLRIVTFTTNALLPEKVLSYAQKIKDKGFDVFITISLDGDKKTHDIIRGVEGNFEKSKSVLVQLTKQNIWSHFGLTVSSFNSEYIEKSLQDDIGKIRSFSFEHAGGIYKTAGQPNEKSIIKSLKTICRIYKIRSLGEIIEYVYIVLAGTFFKSGRKTVPVPCEVIASSLHIRPNGDISPCMYLPKIGNINTGSFSEILSLPATKILRNRAQNTECNKCWMNCYAVHSVMRHPVLSFIETIKARNSVEN